MKITNAVRNFLQLTLFGVVVLLSSTAHALGPDILDTSAVPSSWGGKFIGIFGNTVALDVGQTFTPTISGTLSRMGMRVTREGMPTLPLIVDIRSTLGGTPLQSNSILLGSVTIDASSLTTFSLQNPPGWTYADFSSFNIPVTAGVPLALVLRSNNPTVFDVPGSYYAWNSSAQGENIYAGGKVWSRDGGSNNAWTSPSNPNVVQDMSFQQYVTVVPEPSTIGLIGLGLAAVAIYRRRRFG